MKSILKILIDIGPLAIFFIFYSRGNLQSAILPFMVATIIAVLLSYIIEKKIPIMPFKANTLMEKFNIPEGKELGNKLKMIENVWSNNNFQISEKEVQEIINN